MKLVITQLSDIHFREGSNPVIDRLPQIIASIRQHTMEAVANIIAVSGDIAFSGKLKEYGQARKFFAKLEKALTSKKAPPAYQILFVPGNHDCDFEHQQQARQLIIESIRTHLHRVTRDDNSIADSCLKVQQAFFDFVRQMDPMAEFKATSDRLCYTRKIILEDKLIKFECYNTAWLSQRDEKQGQLFFPESLLTQDEERFDLVVSLFHHPYNWLQPDNARAFRKHVEVTSDLILTGHEHDPQIYEKRNLSDSVSHFMEGAVLQAPDSAESGFNILIVDLNEEKSRAYRYGWNQGARIYEVLLEGPWEQLARKKHLRRHEFENCTSFLNILSDPGAAFTHPRAKDLRLRDLFVYPDAYDTNIKKGTRDAIRGENLSRHVIENPQIVFIGPERSGKSTLSRIFYEDLQQQGVIPLLINGERITRPHEEAFAQLERETFATQYEPTLLQKYLQLDLKERAIIIDDFHKIRLSEQGRAHLLRLLTARFGHILLFGDVSFEIRELMLDAVDEPLILKFRNCHIRPLGHVCRSHLIRNWHKAGDESVLSDEDLAYKVATSENAVDTLLGKNLLPAFPIFVLTILQLLESQTHVKTLAAGSYGHIYEALVTQWLSISMKAYSLDVIYAYLSHLAYYMFRQGRRILAEEEVTSASAAYSSRHSMPLEPGRLISELTSAHVLKREAGGLAFRYEYQYYYFVARYMNDNIKYEQEAEEISGQVEQLTTRIFNEDIANILIFYVYLAKDPKVIARVLQNARGVFSESPACDLDEDVKFLLYGKRALPKFAVYKDERKDAKTKMLRALDDAEQLSEANKAPVQTRDDSLKELDTAPQINVAFKTIQIMGQILRNFPGTLRGELKREIALESYLLGLRTLKVLVGSIESKLDNVRTLVKDLLLTEKLVKDPQELDRKADQFIYFLSLALSAGIIKAISFSVGSEELRQTYRELKQLNSTIPFALIDVSIKLDHFRPLREAEIYELADRLGKSHQFSKNILQALVTEYVYLYPVKEATVQRLCSKLGIKLSRARALGKRGKH